MRKNSQFWRRQPPPEEAQPADPQRFKRYWDAAKGGWKNPHLKFEDWDQRFLSMKQWMEANPGKNEQDYRQYSARLRRPKKRNWLNRALGTDPGFSDFR